MMAARDSCEPDWPGWCRSARNRQIRTADPVTSVPTSLSSFGSSFSTYFVPQSGQGPNQPVLP
jgi:hypothetical protein